jgi:hypothetical protein
VLHDFCLKDLISATRWTTIAYICEALHCGLGVTERRQSSGEEHERLAQEVEEGERSEDEGL